MTGRRSALSRTRSRCRPGLEPLEPRVQPATFVVNTTADGGDDSPGDGIAQTYSGATSLRAAVEEANAYAGADTISVPAGVYQLTAGQLVVDANVTIVGQGSGPTAVVLDGLAQSRIATLAGDNIRFSNLTFRNGLPAGGNGGAVTVTGPSGGVLTFDRVAFENNTANFGGAIAASAGGFRIDLIDSVFRDNSATAGNGGVLDSPGVNVTVTRSTFVGNSTNANGGALSLGTGTVTIQNSTFSGNTAGGSGGAINSNYAANFTLIDSTLSGNTAGGNGGAIFTVAYFAVGNSILAGNTAASGPNGYGNFTSRGYNLIGAIDNAFGFGAAGDQGGTAANPLLALLGPLRDNGGLVPTFNLLPGSPALDAGSTAATTDARGAARGVGGTSDVGAVESQGFGFAQTQPSYAGTVGTPLTPDFFVFVSENGVPLEGATVTFAAPTGGPSGTFASGGTTTTAVADANGRVQPGTFTANGVVGGYTVTAKAGSATTPLNASNVAGAAAAVTITGPGSTVAGVGQTYTVRLVDSYGNTADSYVGSVDLTVDDPQATYPATLSFTSADQGVRTFTLTPRTAGGRTLTVVETSGAVSAASVGIDVTPAGADSYVAAVPSSVQAGNQFSVTLTAYDAYGNVATGYAGTADLTTSDPQATLPPTATFAAGVATVTLTLRTAGSPTVTAVDQLQPDVFTTFAVPVTAAATTGTEFVSAPSSATAGQAQTFTLRAVDAYGNTATNFAGTVTLDSDDPQATLPAAVTFDPVNEGYAAFTATLRTAGPRAITATGPGSATASTTVSVVAAGVSGYAVSAPASSTAGNTVSITFRAVDPYGNTDTTYAGTATLGSSDAQATLPPSVTFSGGVATVAVTFRTAGTQTVNAYDSGLAGTATVVVTPAAASRLDVTASPTAATAGTAVTVTVHAYDAYGNTAVGYGGTVAFSSSDGQATLPANYQFQRPDGGVKAFTVTLRTAGTQTVTVADTGDGSLVGTATVSVTAAAAVALQTVTATTPVTAGTQGAAVLRAVDAYGNTATGYTGTVATTSSDPQATLPGPVTFTPSDAGQLGISFTLATAGAQSVTFTDTQQPALTATANVTVTPAAAATLDIVSAPGSSPAGGVATFTIKLRDAYGNVATGYAGTVQVTTDDAQATAPGSVTFTAGDAGQKSIDITFRSTGPRTATFADATIPAGDSATVQVTPGAVAAFTVALPATADQGQPLTVTITARDAFGNVATGTTGTASLTASDSLASFPPNVSFAAGDAGVRTLTSGVRFFSPGPQTLGVTLGTAGGQAGTSVQNVAPGNLSLTITPANVNEGSTATLAAGFTDPGVGDSFTATITWGDGSTDTLAFSGTTSFNRTHTYADNGNRLVTVTVADNGGGFATGSTTAAVVNVAPVIAPAMDAVTNAGETVRLTGAFADPGGDAFALAVDYGDGSAETFDLGAARSFALSHKYRAEGTYTVRYTVSDDDGGSDTTEQLAHVYLPGVTGVDEERVPSNSSGTASAGGVTATLTTDGDGEAGGILVAVVPLPTAQSLTTVPIFAPNRVTVSYDVRAFSVSLGDRATVTFRYPTTGDPTVTPTLLYYDRALGRFAPVIAPSGYVVDRAAHAVTVVFDASSTPRLADLQGTVFTLSVPAPPTTPVTVFTPGGGPGPAILTTYTGTGATLATAASNAPRVAETTGFLRSNAISLTLAPSEGFPASGGSDDITVADVPVLSAGGFGRVLTAAKVVVDVLHRALADAAKPPAPPPPPAVPLDSPADVADNEDVTDTAPAPADEEATTMDDILVALVGTTPTRPHPDLIDVREQYPPAPVAAVLPTKVAPDRWWLTGAAPAPTLQHEPTAEERAVASLHAAWMGGVALAASMPDPQHERAVETDDEDHDVPAEPVA